MAKVWALRVVSVIVAAGLIGGAVYSGYLWDKKVKQDGAELTRSMDGLNRGLDNLNKSLDDLEKTVKDYNDSIKRLEKATR